MVFYRFFAAFIALAALPTVAQGQTIPPEKPVEVLLLGTYHFGNPGQDVNNMEVDDVTSARRQMELDRLADALARFQPNVVAVERVGEAPDYRDPVFPRFDDAMLAEIRDERVQIGYRLAREAGVERVYAVDEQPSDGERDYFPYGDIQAFLEARDRGDELTTLSAPTQAAMAEFAKIEPHLSIAELLMQINGDLFEGGRFYQTMLLYGEGEDQPGPELLAGWFERNAKIFNKLAQVTRPGDRVVMIYGAGHLHWLRTMIEDAPGYELVDPRPYLEAAR